MGCQLSYRTLHNYHMSTIISHTAQLVKGNCSRLYNPFCFVNRGDRLYREQIEQHFIDNFKPKLNRRLCFELLRQEPL